MSGVAGAVEHRYPFEAAVQEPVIAILDELEGCRYCFEAGICEHASPRTWTFRAAAEQPVQQVTAGDPCRRNVATHITMLGFRSLMRSFGTHSAVSVPLLR
jgi:hypothetical protein